MSSFNYRRGWFFVKHCFTSAVTFQVTDGSPKRSRKTFTGTTGEVWHFAL
jgi:hypothetical protein